MKFALGFFAFIVFASASSAQDASTMGEGAVAERYLAYALKAADEGRWLDAETVLDRAADYASASSDLSYLLAEARRRLGRPIGSVLEAARRALEATRWSKRTSDDARLLEAECLVDLRLFDEALSVLSDCAPGADAELLGLRALRGTGDIPRYLLRMRDALSAYPRDARLVRLLFRSAEKSPKNAEELRLIALSLSRLSFLLDSDPFLAVLASPFVADPAERRRLVAAYRAIRPSDFESLPAALELGLVEENDAVEELFIQQDLDHRLIAETFGLLRSEEAISRFRERLASFSGIIAEDGDRDQRRESEARYERGEIRSYLYDADQDGVFEWSIRFADGLPVDAFVVLAVDSSPDSPALPSRPVSEADRLRAALSWERYPYLAAVRVGDRVFGFPPAGFPFAPVRLSPVVPSSAVRAPKTDTLTPRLTERSLFSFAAWLERPGTLAQGSIERIEYSGGVPLRSIESLDGRPLAYVDYEGGFPLQRRADFDQDGRFETIERYKKHGFDVDYIESDFDGDGIFEKETIK